MKIISEIDPIIFLFAGAFIFTIIGGGIPHLLKKVMSRRRTVLGHYKFKKY